MAGTHAKLSPSGAKRIHACPGAPVLIGTIPPEDREESGPAARLGTAAHFLLEKTLREQVPPETFRDRLIELLGDQEDGSMLRAGAKLPERDLARMKRIFIVDDEMIRGVSIAWYYVMERCAELGFDPAKLRLETRTNPVPERDDTSGTADVTIDAWPMLLEVVDYKNGYRTVEHEDNPQLLAYLAGVAHDTGWAHDEYRIVVVQPNAAHDEGRVRPFETTADELRAFVVKHRRAAQLVDEADDAFTGDQDAPVGNGVGEAAGEMANVPWSEMFLHPGDHCDMCEAAFICKAKKRWLQQEAKVDFDDDPFAIEPPSSLDEAVKVFLWAPRMTAHIKAARAMVNAAAQGGNKPAALKYVAGQGKGAWKPGLGIPDAVADALVADGYISDNERALIFEPVALLTGPKVEKLIKAKDGVPGTERKKAFREKYMETKPGMLTLVSADDPREEVVLKAGEQFDDDPFGDD